jgi:hypothetical protein
LKFECSGLIALSLIANARSKNQAQDEAVDPHIVPRVKHLRGALVANNVIVAKINAALKA